MFAMALLAPPGCGQGPAPGVVTGLVLFNGHPAAGKRVSLVGSEAKGSTDANGRYTFSGLGAKRYQVLFVSQGDRPEAVPNEVAQWRSVALDLADGAGREVPAFDVAYNGLLYPEAGMALIVNTTSLVPFHWSTHPSAQRYRVTIGGANNFAWQSEWVGEPTTVFGKEVAPGSYQWQVEFDGSERGAGVSRPRPVDF